MARTRGSSRRRTHMRCPPVTRRTLRSDAVTTPCSDIAVPEERTSCSHAAAVAGLLVLCAHSIAGSTLVVPNQCTLLRGHCPPERARKRPACRAPALGVAHRGHRPEHSAPANRCLLRCHDCHTGTPRCTLTTPKCNAHVRQRRALHTPQTLIITTRACSATWKTQRHCHRSHSMVPYSSAYRHSVYNPRAIAG